MNIRVLLVEDDIELARRLATVLDGAGFVVDAASDGDEGWHLGRTMPYDAVVLDLGLPLVPGLEVLRRWRAAGNHVPVLVLSARGTWSERIAGLNAGADDYLGKPFEPAEVVARLRALIRRASGTGDPVLRHGELELNTTTGIAFVASSPIDLTARELKILGYLMARQGRIVSQAELADHVYGMDDLHQSNTIEVHVARLRKKIGRDAIRTVRGLGYRLG